MDVLDIEMVLASTIDGAIGWSKKALEMREADKLSLGVSNDGLIVHSKKDMKRFKEVTQDCIMICGFSTYKLVKDYIKLSDSRQMIVLSKSFVGDRFVGDVPDYVYIANGLMDSLTIAKDLIDLCNRVKKVVVIGGASIYALFMKANIVNTIYYTKFLSSSTNPQEYYVKLDKEFFDSLYSNYISKEYQIEHSTVPPCNFYTFFAKDPKKIDNSIKELLKL